MNADSKDDKWTLYRAACKGRIDIVQRLLNNGANSNYDKSTALYRAAREGHTEIVRLLLENGANPNHPIATWALYWGRA